MKSAAATAMFVAAAIAGPTGCGTPGAPQPPSLNLPERTTDLTAERAGDVVTLHWTDPRKNTDHLLIKGEIEAQICRREGPAASEISAGKITVPPACQPAGLVTAAPGAAAEFHDTLPAALASGDPRPITYTVELRNRLNHGAGPSNEAVILAGAAPPIVTGLSAEVHSSGVALRWDSYSGAGAAIRLHRKLLNPPAAAGPKSKTSRRDSAFTPAASGPVAEAPLRDLFVDPQPANGSAALDKSARFGSIYEYTAQRVIQLSVGGESLELAGPVSSPIRVTVADTFPPAIPNGLAAVYDPAGHAIDLSWQSGSEDDLAGYVVYRAESGSSTWTRISAQQPLPDPAFSDKTVVPGHVYRYSVSAVDLNGHESRRSVEAREPVPASEQ